MSSILQQRQPPGSLRLGSIVTGVDIGTHSAKLVVRRWSGGCWRIVGASCLRLSPTARANAAELARTLRPWLREQGEAGRRDLVCSLPSELVDYEAVPITPEDGDNLAHCAEESMRQLLGDETSLAAFDYWCAVSAGKHAPTTLHLAWTASDFAAQLASSLTKDGWRVLAIDAPFTSAACAAADPNKSTLAVDIGGGQASLIWSRGGVAEYVRNRVPFAARSATDELSEAMGIRATAAEELLASWGLGDSAEAVGQPLEVAVTKHLAGWLGKLNFELGRTIQYLQLLHGGSAVAEIVLCGGGACVRGLSRWLESRINLPVRRADLPSGWHWHAAEPYSPLYAQAVALTRYGDHQ